MRTPEELLCRRGWRIKHSAWMLWGILSFGLLWGVGFAIIGLRSKNRFWIGLAAVWLVYMVAYFALAPAAEMSEKGDPLTPLGAAIAWVLFLSWIGGGVLAWFVNRKWLVWRAHNGPRRPWYAEPISSSDIPSPTSAPSAEAVDVALRTSGPVSFPRGSTALDSANASGGAAGVASDPPIGPVDLNSASREQLAALPGIGFEQAEHIIATRQRVGGFGSPAELVTTANVQPHVFAGIQDRLVVAQAPLSKPGAPNDGRRLEF